MLHTAPSAVPVRLSAHTAPTVTALVGALRAEEQILRGLGDVLRAQRAAIADDDLEQLDDAVFATHRLLVTLAEARKRRRTVNELMGEGDDLSLEAVHAAFGGAPPQDVAAALAALADAGARLQREVDVNQTVLHVAIDAGDQLVRALASGPARLGRPGRPGGSEQAPPLLFDGTA
jgi:hypothetical protein